MQTDRLCACDCSLERKTFVYVGRAVKFRNRTQRHLFPTVTTRPSAWVQEFLNEPHEHQLLCMAWYVPKEELGVAEATLIDLLKPIRNAKDRGFGSPRLWTLRLPDVIVDIGQFEPEHRKGSAANSSAKNESAVYAWFVDPGLELVAMMDGLEELWESSPNKEALAAFKSTIAKRLASVVHGDISSMI